MKYFIMFIGFLFISCDNYKISDKTWMHPSGQLIFYFNDNKVNICRIENKKPITSDYKLINNDIIIDSDTFKLRNDTLKYNKHHYLINQSPCCKQKISLKNKKYKWSTIFPKQETELTLNFINDSIYIQDIKDTLSYEILQFENQTFINIEIMKGLFNNLKIKSINQDSIIMSYFDKSITLENKSYFIRENE